MEYSINEISEIMERHNKLVKDVYKCNKIGDFVAWLEGQIDDEEGYIEIPSNETISGHAEILEYEG